MGYAAFKPDPSPELRAPCARLPTRSKPVRHARLPGRLLVAKLRGADIDAAAGAVEEVARVVARIRTRWPRTRVLLRADSGFARDDLMTWCEGNGVDFVFGLQKNERLIAMIEGELAQAEAKSRRTGEPERRFKSFVWTTRTSRSRRRRVVAKAEWTKGEANPRFVVTSLRRNACEARRVYEGGSTAPAARWRTGSRSVRLDLYADRTSAATMRANQLRLWFHSMAYTLRCIGSCTPKDASARTRPR